MATMRALLILLPPVSVLFVVAARTLGRIAARNLSALARVQLACLPASGGSSESKKRSNSISEGEVLRVAPYRRNKGDEEECCVVCLSAIEEGEETRELRCRHLFHRSCLDRWLQARPAPATCPLCRCRLLAPPPEEEHCYDGEEDSDMMLFMACVHGRSTWFWPSSS